MAMCGYPCDSCPPTCAQPDLCATLEKYGCDAGGGGPAYTFTNGLTLTGLDAEWGGTLEHHTSIAGTSQFNTSFLNLQQFLVSTARLPANSIVEMLLGSTTASGAIITHRNTGNQQATLNINHTGTTILGQNNAFNANAEVQIYGTSGLAPTVDLIAGAGGPLKTFRVSNSGYFMINPNAKTDQTNVLYWDSVTEEIRYGNPTSFLFPISDDERMLVNLTALKSEVGYRNDIGSVEVKLVVEKVTSPTTATVIKLLGLNTYANDVAAAAVLPSKSLWRDASNNVKIVP